MTQSLYEFCMLHAPDLLKQWDGEKNGALAPTDVGRYSTRKVWWRCGAGHSWLAMISNRAKGNGCPVCSGRMVVAGVNDLAARRPELLTQWHPTKNQGLSPHGLACNSRQQVWWQCEKGHQWQAPVASRYRGNGCPICSNRKIVAGINDLATVAPDLAAQWDREKNGDLTPDQLGPSSAKKVWWRCEQGHLWRSAVLNRYQGCGCPVCSCRQIQAGVNDLATISPDLAAQWDWEKNGALTPQKVSLHAGRRIWWRCEKGHSWRATVASRTSGNGCPVCANRKVLVGFNDLASARPELAEQWDREKNGALTPEAVTPRSGRKVWWRCGAGHSWRAVIASRTAGCGCPVCTNREIQTGFNDLASALPDLAAQWDWEKNGTLTPQQVLPGSSRRVWWRCGKGHTWLASISSRARGNGCPCCAGHRVIPGETDLATTAPELAAQWHPEKNGALTPGDIKAKSGRRVWWLCPQGHAWPASPLKRSRGDGCPVCSRRRVLEENSLAVCHPELAGQWHPEKNGQLTPLQVGHNAWKKVWWQCALGHAWQASVAARAAGAGCPVCGDKVLLRGFNDLATRSPQLAGEWHPCKNGSLTPEMVLASAGRKVWWRCPRGHDWYGGISARRRGKNCPKCATELHTSFAEQAIFLYVSQFFPAHNRYLFKNREIDVYIPSLSVGIEHDGVFHQQESVRARDARKDRLLRANGITLIRVKTGTENDMDKEQRIICYQDKRSDHSGLTWAIGKLFVLLEELSGRPLPVDVDLARDTARIYQQYIRLEKERSLAARVPEALAYWHPTKNGTLLPSHFSAGSGKYVWWRCEKGHDWRSRACSFTQGYRCPYCTGRKVLRGFNDLATVNPRLAGQWHPEKNGSLGPEDVKAFSNRKVWWRCEKGHEWRNTVNNRSAGKNCPICASQQVLEGYNDLASRYPALAEQWDREKNGSLTPESVTPRSGRKVWWRCPRGHRWEARIADRTAGNGCPFCSGRLAISGESDLATLDPALAAQWHPERNGTLTPRAVKPFSHHAVWWKCGCGHVWRESVAGRSHRRSCPGCGKPPEN